MKFVVLFVAAKWTVKVQKVYDSTSKKVPAWVRHQRTPLDAYHRLFRRQRRSPILLSVSAFAESSLTSDLFEAMRQAVGVWLSPLVR